MILTILKNIRPDAPETKLFPICGNSETAPRNSPITPHGEDTLTTAGSPHKATHYVVKVELAASQES